MAKKKNLQTEAVMKVHLKRVDDAFHFPGTGTGTSPVR